MSACREARRLISRRPTKSPRLKLPLPCLNSHNGVSGDPVWKTSLTLWKPYMFNWRTNDEMLVCLKYEDKTLENSLEGDMTKLSFVLAHEMRCWMLWSSSML
jgi:hypothetical protein